MKTDTGMSVPNTRLQSKGTRTIRYVRSATCTVVTCASSPSTAGGGLFSSFLHNLPASVSVSAPPLLLVLIATHVVACASSPSIAGGGLLSSFLRLIFLATVSKSAPNDLSLGRRKAQLPLFNPKHSTFHVLYHRNNFIEEDPINFVSL